MAQGPIPARAKPVSGLETAQIRRLAAALASWFAEAAREMPWRKTRDPYRVWVSEIMLQQTRVDTVRRYYGPFLEAFPTIEALAAAQTDEVLRAWSGLGYYRRARLLHRGAQYVVQTHRGRLPSEAQDLRAVPGVGPYTAGAIGAIAFDQSTALVDGNIARVSSRLHALELPAHQDAKYPLHWDFAGRVLENGSPRVLAQALMELGATVCTPRSPDCGCCPIASACEARARGLVDSIPTPKVRKKSPVDVMTALVVRRADRVLLLKRPATGLLAGMWCVPLLAEEDEMDAWASRLGSPLGRVVRGGQVRHVFTHRIWLVDVVTVVARRQIATGSRRQELDPLELCWVAPDEPPPGGMARVTEKILALARSAP